MEGAGPDLHVVGLQDDAAVIRPIALKRQDQPLEGAARVHVAGVGCVHGGAHAKTRSVGLECRADACHAAERVKAR